MAKSTSAPRSGHLIMTLAYSYNDGWTKFAKENFANLVKSQKSRTLNLKKFSRYTVLDKPDLRVDVSIDQRLAAVVNRTCIALQIVKTVFSAHLLQKGHLLKANVH